ncbi:MAG: WG repeat-containing protein, partial [Candidatus Spechtbacterales bacterium]|nr:WG repeat-containing protein [Candidatus Spechtbacterales bacterium]
DETYDDARSFQEGLARVKKDDEWFFIDKNGDRISDETYDSAESFHEGLARVVKDDEWFFIDRKGNKIF